MARFDGGMPDCSDPEALIYHVVEEFVSGKKSAIFVALSTWFEADPSGEHNLFCPPTYRLVSSAKSGEARQANWEKVRGSYDVLESYGKIFFLRAKKCSHHDVFYSLMLKKRGGLFCTYKKHAKKSAHTDIGFSFWLMLKKSARLFFSYKKTC